MYYRLYSDSFSIGLLRLVSTELVNMCVGEENVSREKGVCRYDLAEKILHILIEPCHRENIENTYLVTLCLHTILFVYIIVNVCKQLRGW